MRWLAVQSGLGRLDLAALDAAAFACLTPGSDTLAGQAEDRSAIIEQQLDPRPFAHLRKVNTAEEKPGDEMADADIDRCVTDRVDRLEIAFRAVRS